MILFGLAVKYYRSLLTFSSPKNARGTMTRSTDRAANFQRYAARGFPNPASSRKEFAPRAANRGRTFYIEGLSIRSESVAATRGRRPWVPDRQIAKPVLPSGQAYARDQGASDEAPDPRLDGNPEE